MLLVFITKCRKFQPQFTAGERPGAIYSGTEGFTA